MGRIIDFAFECGKTYTGSLQAPCYDNRLEKIINKRNIRDICRAWWSGRNEAGVEAPRWYYEEQVLIKEVNNVYN